MAKNNVTRRSFIQTTAAGASVLAVSGSKRVLGANDRARLAWIGCGGRGSYLSRRALTVDEIEIVAACDLILEKANRVAEYVKEEENRSINTYVDFRKMIEKEELDGVVVATEVGNHAKVVVPVLEAGLNCLSEKCVDANIDNVDAVTRAARKAKGIYQVAFQRRSDIGYRAGVQAIHDGQIGDVAFMQGQWHWGGTGHVGGWVGNVDISGGKLNEQACHHMDLMSWVMGNIAPTHCVAIGAITVDYKNPYRHQAENMSSVAWHFPTGAILSYTHLHGVPDAFTGEKSWVVGKNGGVNLLQGVIYVRGQEPKPVSDKAPSWGDDSVRGELIEFVECLRSGKTPTSNAETARIATLMTLMAEKAMFRRDQNSYGPGIIKWEDIGSTT
ncbi:MAG: Gfo/Idh/MocA family oxidoreductase [Candidatus Omnitrophica bacterium]|nr:Gfo/Idh/MocA family oxidoreductase [Candidatus Omnitrophota bacterium]